MKKAGVVGSSSSNEEEEEEKAKGLEGTRLNLPVNCHGNLKSASTDQNLIDHLHNIKSSKTPVSDPPFSFSLTKPSLQSFLSSSEEWKQELEAKVVVIIKSENKKIKFKSRGCYQAVVNYGASWCRVCSQILPSFCQLSNEFPKLSFIYADIDECPETTQSIRYTPTFHFFRDGEKVDEMFGAGEERLRDRLWLHS